MKSLFTAGLIAFGSTVSLATDSGPSASGHGNLTVFGGQQTLSFHARRFEDGSVNGSLVAKSRGQNARIMAELDCLKVTVDTLLNTGTAVMTGVISKSNNPTFPEGHKVFFRVIDNGEGSQAFEDTMSDVLVYPVGSPGLPVDCNADFFLPQMSIEAGNIQVRAGT